MSVGVPALAGDGISRAKGKPPEGGTPTFGWHALRNEGRGKATNHALRSSGRATQPAMGQVARRGNRLKAGLQRKAGRMDAIPELDVLCRDHMSETAQENWAASGLGSWDVPVEEWTSAASNRVLRYATHGIFRYFGKFPPLIARHLITQFTAPGDLLLDPMIGSGTTAVEAGLLGRRCTGLDVNPLSLLLTRVKCRRIPAARLRRRLSEIQSAVDRRGENRPASPARWPTSVRTSHWFLPETSHWLQVLRECIAELDDETERDFFLAVYAGIVRRVSRHHRTRPAVSRRGRRSAGSATSVHCRGGGRHRRRLRFAARRRGAHLAAIVRPGVRFQSMEGPAGDMPPSVLQRLQVLGHPLLGNGVAGVRYPSDPAAGNPRVLQGRQAGECAPLRDRFDRGAAEPRPGAARAECWP